MENYNLSISKKLTRRLYEAFVPKSVTENDRFELRIRLKDKDISIRQLAAYLNFIDNSYGRLSPKGILSYSQSQRHELRIAEIRHGSLEIILSNYLSNANSVIALILIGLLLKYLPGIIKSTLSAYRDYEEAKLAKVRRQQIKEQIKNDQHLKNLNDEQVIKLSNLFDVMYGADMRNLLKAHKLSNETVMEVSCNVTKIDITIQSQATPQTAQKELKEL